MVGNSFPEKRTGRIPVTRPEIIGGCSGSDLSELSHEIVLLQRENAFGVGDQDGVRTSGRSRPREKTAPSFYFWDDDRPLPRLGQLLLHLLTASRYGIFRDEMYYLACAQRRIVHQCNASFSCDSAK